MKRDFNYSTISISDIEANNHLIFVCCGDERQVLLERNEDEKNRFIKSNK